MSFLDSLDIANLALHFLGQPKILTVGEDSKANTAMSFAYDKLREPELRRNNWTFAIKRCILRPIDSDTRLLAPRVWAAGTLYLPGSIVIDGNGDFWSSDESENLNNEPGVSDAWEQYFGPLSVHLYDSTDAYSTGELVYKIVGSGGFVVYRSLSSNNSDDPSTVTAWDATVTYTDNAFVSYSSTIYRSVIPVNFNVTPANAPNPFDLAIIYAISNTVTGSDGYIYSSVGNGNVGNDPVTNAGVNWTNTGVPNAWDSTPTIYASSSKWLPVYAGLKRLTVPYTVNAAKNFFRLPANWLREAPQSPKTGSQSVFGAPSGLAYNDWEYENGFLLSTEVGPILYRFSADVTVVSTMDSMYCTGLAARMAEETCEELTQQTDKMQAQIGRYNKVMGEARLVNAIEQGPTEPPEDDYVTCRT